MNDSKTTTKRDMTAIGVAKLLAAKQPGRWRVSANLYLQTKPSGAGSWLLRYARPGSRKNVWVGLGRAKLFTLQEARLRAARHMKLLADGVDPLEHKRAGHRQEVEAKREQELASISFRKIAQEFMKTRWQSWSEVHRNQWYASLAAFTWPIIGDMPIGAVTSDDVVRCLEPIWATKTETASRLRGKIETVLDYAKACDLRTGENPAAWKGNLAHRLAAPRKLHRVEHFAALPYEQVPALMAQLAERHEVAARALEFCILTAARTGEVLGSQWREIDAERKVWTIPGSRMKAGRAHVVPLSDAALACLDEPSDELADAVFAYTLNQGRRKALGPNCMMALLKRVTKGVTVHGFRSAFRDWAAEQTNYPSEVIEMALAHATGTAVERAYRRTDLLAKRAALMADWARFCTGTTQPADTVDRTVSAEADFTCVIIGDHIGPLETLQ